MTDEKLIEEARGWDAEGVHQHAVSALDAIRRLADALEAHNVKNRPEGREALIEEAAKAMAILDDYDGCFERLAAWRNATGDQRESGEVEEPLSFDDEDAEFWLKRARAALAVFEKAQAEPTDAQVLAALVESSRVEHDQYNIKRPFSPAATLGDYDVSWVDRMRAALRAAFAVKEGGTDE